MRWHKQKHDEICERFKLSYTCYSLIVSCQAVHGRAGWDTGTVPKTRAMDGEPASSDIHMHLFKAIPSQNDIGSLSFVCDRVCQSPVED